MELLLGYRAGIVSKPVRKPVDKLTTFQETRGVSIRRKRHSDRHLELLDRVERAVKVVNCRLSSLRRSPILRHNSFPEAREAARETNR